MHGRRLLALPVLVLAVALAVLLLTRDDDPGPAPEPRGPGPALTWAPPPLEDPETVEVAPGRSKLKLEQGQDYRIVMPDRPLTDTGGLTISGGRNVVLVGGEIAVPWQGAQPRSHQRRALFLKDQQGTVHVEGLLLRGDDLAEGVDLEQRRGAVVQLQNIRVETIRARDERNFTDTHPDLVQSWAGPAELRIDRFTGFTTYQGFFLVPTEAPPRLIDLRRVELVGVERGRYLLWRDPLGPVRLRDVHLATQQDFAPHEVLWPRPEEWRGVRHERPAQPFVPEGVAGIGYRSPGYRVGGAGSDSAE